MYVNTSPADDTSWSNTPSTATMDSIELAVRISLSLLVILNILLHSFGIHLLRKFERKERDPHFIFIINLSIVEITINISSLFVLVLQSFLCSDPVQRIVDVVHIAEHTLLNFVFYMNIILLTVNKLLEILFHMKYPIYLNTQNVRRIIVTMWIIGFVVFLAIILLFELTDFDYEAFDRYYFIMSDFLVLAIVTTSYGFIFYKYVESRRYKPSQRRVSTESLYHIFRHSKFHISVCIVVSFVLFLVIPDLLLECLRTYHRNDNVDVIMFIVAFLYAFLYTFHALIYIFVQPKVKQLLLKLVYSKGKTKNGVVIRGKTAHFCANGCNHNNV